MKTSFPANCALVILAILVFAGCGPSPSASTPSATPGTQSAAQVSSSAAPAATAPGQPYDFYILNLSWSPEFCLSHPNSSECAAHPGFVVHGLWPQNNDGTYPEHCPTRPGPTSPAAWQGLQPTPELAQHEWETHGTCTPYDADTFFGLTRKAFNQVRIPAAFTNTTSQTMETPAVILSQFLDANPSIPAAAMALSCGNNYLTAIEVCFDKGLHPTACQAVRTCRANQVKITPR